MAAKYSTAMQFQHDPKIRPLARSATDLPGQETKCLLNIDKMLSREGGQLEATLALVLFKINPILLVAETEAKEEEVEV